MTPEVEFEEFVRSYQDMVYTTALRLLQDPGLAEDVAQDTFLKAWERFAEVKGGSPGGWLKTVATNAALNLLTRRVNRWAPLDAAAERPDPAPAPQAAAEESETRGSLERALATLPDHQRVPLVLFHFDELSYDDIAAKLNVPLSKVKSDIFRGREALRRSLEVPQP